MEMETHSSRRWEMGLAMAELLPEMAREKQGYSDSEKETATEATCSAMEMEAGWGSGPSGPLPEVGSDRQK